MNGMEQVAGKRDYIEQCVVVVNRCGVQWADTGIFDFLYSLPEFVFKHPDFNFKTPSEVIDSYDIRGAYDGLNMSSWADTERDLSAWRSNPIQHEALRRIYDLEQAVYEQKSLVIRDIWQKLTTSDHFYYMCTKYWADGDVHKYFSPYDSPLEAFNYFNSACAHLELLLNEKANKISRPISKRRSKKLQEI